MPKHTYDVTIGKDTYAVESDNELTDAQAYQYAKSQVPFDVKAQNATARRNMAAQPTEAEMQARGASEPWTTTAMLDRAKAGVKGEAEGFGGGLAAPLLLGYHVLRHPVDSADEAAQAALALGVAGAHAVAHPIDTYNAAKPAVLRFAQNPENIGMVAGGLDAALATPALISAAKGTKVGQAVSAGVSDALDRVPGVRAARAVLHPPTPKPAVVKIAKPTAAAAEAERLATAGVVPNADAAASNPAIAAPTQTRTPYTLPPEFQPLSYPEDEAAAVLAQVVPTADAVAESMHGVEMPPQNPLRQPYSDHLTPAEGGFVSGLTPAQNEALRAEVFQRNVTDPAHYPGPAEPSSRATTPTFEQIGKGGRGNETGATPSGQVAIPAEAPPVAKFAFEWPGVGDQYQLVSDIPGHPAGSTVSAKVLTDAGIPLPPKTGGMSAEQALIGSRGMGHLNLEGRKALLAEMLKRSAGGTE